MTADDRLRDLERRARLGEDVRVQLRAEQERLGLRKHFPPRTKAYRHLQPLLGWCPRCRQWSIKKVPQKQRSRRKKAEDRLPRRVCTTRFMGRIYETCPFRAVPVGARFHAGRPRDSAAAGSHLWEKVNKGYAVSVEVYQPTRDARDRSAWVAFAHETEVGYQPDSCSGPAKGEICRPPIDVLEARIRELEHRSAGTFDHEEIAWCRWRIKKALDRLPAAPARRSRNRASKGRDEE